ncbi:hypothetical protein [Nocardioides sp. cx-173]|uniref:hypothetical protein n=1 Tax=Nocardioides sp. cx-173 TaxID=2898796 RepID=UPI001E4E454E|nr:hypothetical protein [Nocardioides sp. cx-173]MCD4525376.1 hypothetical protein [Nocardioides sp. cx-173]UGB40828.1 hypothetical protein LQ940_15780 [Nocardioides sp. cx-173]
MASRVVLHVGLMKSGTSYVQRRLEANRGLLAERGVLLPGRRWRDQMLAVSDVLGRTQQAGKSEGRWQALLDEVAAHEGTALVSMEFLGPAKPASIERVLASLAPAPVEVVLTLRDLGRAIPAMWQEGLQNGGTLAWAEYVGQFPGAQQAGRMFWLQQGMGRIAGNWTDAVGADRVALVTVPPPGADPGLLWARFCEASGVPAADGVDVPPANTSLDAVSAVLLRELNLRLRGDHLRTGEYHRLVKFEVAKQRLAGRGGPPIGFDPTPWLRQRALEIEDRLRATGARVVGGFGDLEPVRVPGIDPGTVPVDAAMLAQVEALRADVLGRRAG